MIQNHEQPCQAIEQMGRMQRVLESLGRGIAIGLEKLLNEVEAAE